MRRTRKAQAEPQFGEFFTESPTKLRTPEKEVKVVVVRKEKRGPKVENV